METIARPPRHREHINCDGGFYCTYKLAEWWVLSGPLAGPHLQRQLCGKCRTGDMQSPFWSTVIAERQFAAGPYSTGEIEALAAELGQSPLW